MARKQNKPPTEFNCSSDVFDAYVAVLQRHGAKSRQDRLYWSNPELAKHMSPELAAQMLGMRNVFITYRAHHELLAKRR